MKKLADISKFEALQNSTYSQNDQPRTAVSNGIGVTYKGPDMANGNTDEDSPAVRDDKVQEALELAGRRYGRYQALLDDVNADRPERGFRVHSSGDGGQYTSDVNMYTGQLKPRRQVVTKPGYSDARRGAQHKLSHMSPDETYEVLKACADAVRNGDMTKYDAQRWIKKAYGLGQKDIKRFIETYSGNQNDEDQGRSNMYRLNNLPSGNRSVGAYDYRRKQ